MKNGSDYNFFLNDLLFAKVTESSKHVLLQKYTNEVVIKLLVCWLPGPGGIFRDLYHVVA